MSADAPEGNACQPDDAPSTAIHKEVKPKGDEEAKEADKDCFTFHFSKYFGGLVGELVGGEEGGGGGFVLGDGQGIHRLLVTHLLIKEADEVT